MIVMTMAKHYSSQIGKVYSHLCRIFKECIRLASIEEDLVAILFNVEGNAVFINECMVLTSCIFNQCYDPEQILTSRVIQLNGQAYGLKQISDICGKTLIEERERIKYFIQYPEYDCIFTVVNCHTCTITLSSFLMEPGPLLEPFFYFHIFDLDGKIRNSHVL